MEDIEKLIKERMKNRPRLYPFKALDWEIHLSKNENTGQKICGFGHYGTEEVKPQPFYRPIIKTVDLAKMDK